jgi:drug/metabolite transporter (DMT)-like permease
LSSVRVDTELPADDASRIHSRGLALIMVSAVSFSIGTTILKAGLVTRLAPIPLLAVRFILSAALMWLGMGLIQPHLIRIDRRGLLWCMVAGISNSVSMLCFYFALSKIDLSVVQVSYSIHPVVVLLFLALGGERIALQDLLRLALAVGGIYLLVGAGNIEVPGALVFIAGVLIFYPLHLVLIQWRLGGYHPLTVALYIITAAMVSLSIVYMLAFHGWQPISASGWLVIAGTVIFSTIVGRIALFAGIQHIGSGETSLLSPVETLLTVLWAAIFLSERLMPVQWAGGVLILVSSALGAWPKPRNP